MMRHLPFYTCLTKTPMPLPLISPTMHMATLWSINQATRGWRLRKGRLHNVNVRGRSQHSPHHSNDGPDDPIVPYRPLLHRTNLHANLPPLSAKSSARRASRQACVSLTGRLVYLNVWVYSLLCWSPLLPCCCKPQNNMAASTAYAY